jgi:hypothetical protein
MNREKQINLQMSDCDFAPPSILTRVVNRGILCHFKKIKFLCQKLSESFSNSIISLEYVDF